MPRKTQTIWIIECAFWPGEWETSAEEPIATHEAAEYRAQRLATDNPGWAFRATMYHRVHSGRPYASRLYGEPMNATPIEDIIK